MTASAGHSGDGEGGADGRDGSGQVFADMRLPGSADAIAPDGSHVRVLLRLGGGSMAHFALDPDQVTRPVAHHSVDEIWYVISGHGEMWRRQPGHEETVPLRPGTCVSIPAGTSFQFRCGSDGPLAIVAITMPPWPGDGEAYVVTGPWAPDVPGPR